MSLNENLEIFVELNKSQKFQAKNEIIKKKYENKLDFMQNQINFLKDHLLQSFKAINEKQEMNEKTENLYSQTNNYIYEKYQNLLKKYHFKEEEMKNLNSRVNNSENKLIEKIKYFEELNIQLKNDLRKVALNNELLINEKENFKSEIYLLEQKINQLNDNFVKNGKKNDILKEKVRTEVLEKEGLLIQNNELQKENVEINLKLNDIYEKSQGLFSENVKI